MNALVRLALLTVPVALAAASTAAAAPIPEGPDASSLPVYSGAPATPEPLTASPPPRHPFMAPNERSNLHDDAYQTDAYRTLGPLGRDVLKQDTFLGMGECASITFDSRGRLVTVCVSVAGPTLAMIDPTTLDVLATYSLPPRDPSTLANLFTSFGGGGYFYLDNRDRAVVPTTSRHLLVVGETSGAGFALERDYDVSGVVGSGDSILSALPDWSGRLWFATARGIVGTVDPGTGAVKAMSTGEPIGNSFAVDETGGVYIVSDGAMYRFDAAADGAPRVTWREPYANVGVVKPGQTERGSGTTPTLMGKDYVSITDNADPMNVVVFRRRRTVGGSRLVCTQPVFGRGASDTDQSLIGTDTSMVVENNYGYSGPAATQNGKTTVPGLARVDINSSGRGCHTVWTNSQEHAPSVVPKLSLGTGIVYTYTKDPQPNGADAWYFTALSFRTGRTLWKRLGGEGLGHNNNYAPITIGPDSSMYLGVLGGLVMIRDRVRPTLPPGSGPGARRPRLSLVLHFRRGRTHGRRRLVCSRTSPRAVVGGPDRRFVRRVDFYLGRRRVLVDRRAPFRAVIRRRGLRHGARYTVRARIRLLGGGRVTETRSFRNC